MSTKNNVLVSMKMFDVINNVQLSEIVSIILIMIRAKLQKEYAHSNVEESQLGDEFECVIDVDEIGECAEVDMAEAVEKVITYFSDISNVYNLENLRQVCQIVWNEFFPGTALTEEIAEYLHDFDSPIKNFDFVESQIHLNLLKFLETDIWPLILRFAIENASQEDEGYLISRVALEDLKIVFPNINEYDRKAHFALDLIAWLSYYNLPSLNHIGTLGDSLVFVLGPF